MSIAEWNSLTPRPLNGVATNGSHASNGSHSNNGSQNGNARTLHRLGAVRRQQGVSQRNIARRLNVDISLVRRQEEETTDLPLSVLYQWQKILEVPIAELLVDSDAPLSPPVMERARMVKVMKTVAAIVEKAETASMKRMVQMLVQPTAGNHAGTDRRGPVAHRGPATHLEEYGRVVERQQPDDMFRRRSR